MDSQPYEQHQIPSELVDVPQAQNAPQPTPREIFKYSIRGKTHASDPILVWERLYAAMQAQGVSTSDFSEKSKQTAEDTPPQFRVPALATIGRIAAATFGVKLVDRDPDQGVTAMEAVALLESYFDWEANLAKKREASLPCSQSTEPRSGIIQDSATSAV